MKDLKRRIEALEADRSDPVNDFLYELVCKFADHPPKKHDDVSLTLKQLGEVLPV